MFLPIGNNTGSDYDADWGYWIMTRSLRYWLSVALVVAGSALCVDVFVHGEFFDGSYLMILQPCIGVLVVVIGLVSLIALPVATRHDGEMLFSPRDN